MRILYNITLCTIASYAIFSEWAKLSRLHVVMTVGRASSYHNERDPPGPLEYFVNGLSLRVDHRSGRDGPGEYGVSGLIPCYRRFCRLYPKIDRQAVSIRRTDKLRQAERVHSQCPSDGCRMLRQAISKFPGGNTKAGKGLFEGMQPRVLGDCRNGANVDGLARLPVSESKRQRVSRR